jgi:LPS-assembly protein
MPALVVSPDLIHGGDGRAAPERAAPPVARPVEATGGSVGIGQEKPVDAGKSERHDGAPVHEIEIVPLKPGEEPESSPAEPRAETTISPAPVLPAASTPQTPTPQTSLPQTPPPQPDAVAERAPSAPPAPDGATGLTALRIHGTRAVEMVAEGEAELQRDALLLTADRLVYREPLDEAVAEGNVRLSQGDSSMSGPAARLVIGEYTGEFQSPSYRLSRTRPPLEEGDPPRVVSGGGQADVLHLDGENQYRAENATWSTCRAPDPDWYLKAGELRLDYDREIGTANDSVVVFKGVPIFWAPWAEFPLAGQRQSGILPPTIGTTNKTGFDLSVPYYWNIAPNYDFTFTPRFMSRRGLQLGGELRYLGAAYNGAARAEWLPRDNVSDERRSLGSWQHQHWLTPSVYASFDLNAVSDDEYFEDLSSRVSMASKVNLLREGRLMYVGGGWWNAQALVQSYQTLSSDPMDPVVTPYRRVPQLSLNTSRPDEFGGFDLAAQGEYVRFTHPDEGHPDASRFTAYPRISWPFVRPGYYLTPRLGLHYTRYAIDRDRNVPEMRDDITRSVPVFSVDSGMTFERETRFFGQDFVQTLEPRLYYLNTAYRRQDDIPLFDSSRYDFGFAQIFSENLYTGGDRIADANQLTVAVTSRFIGPATGEERLKFILGQRYYFEDQKVTLNYRDERGAPVLLEAPRTERRTDVLAGISGRLGASSTVESLWQYNTREDVTERFNATWRYNPGFARAMNVSYRYTRDILRDLDVSGQWPLWGKWFGVARLTESLKDKRLTEAIGGVEYNGGCWMLRIAFHRFVTREDNVTKAFFMQLELNDLASIGSSPVSLIKRSVPGYGQINETGGNRVFGNE